jgi:Flp pilus assembly protein TadD
MDTLGWVYLKRLQYSDAVKSFQDAVNMSPKHPTLRYHLGLAHSKAGDRNSAKKALEASLKLSSTFPEAKEVKKLLQEL